MAVDLLTQELAAELQQAGVKALNDAEDAAYDNRDDSFCGCSDCVVRVVLDGVWPLVEQASKNRPIE